MKQKNHFSTYLLIGTMLFGMFFGAGNIIFPISMGQLAGTNFWPALIGFLITAIGLPFLGIIAIGLTNSRGVKELASSVHPIFGLLFSILLYLTIGPFFAIPRTATVPFVVGIEPYINPEYSTIILASFTFIFFSCVLYFSLNPAKILDYIARYLTPIFLLFLFALIIISIVRPMGSFVEPSSTYINEAFLTGFKDGYHTMDALASLAFGIIVVQALKQRGITEPKEIGSATVKSGLIAITLMAIIYGFITYMGASSVLSLGMYSNGGQLLNAISNFYFGSYGALFLTLIFIIACLKTSIGLITACSEFFHEIVPKISYRQFVVILCIISFSFANFGLSTIISYSEVVLMFLYPLAIVLIILSLIQFIIKINSTVYISTIIFTLVISFFDGYNTFIKNIPLGELSILTDCSKFLSQWIPLYKEGLGWIVPSIIGFSIGYIIYFFTCKSKNVKNLLHRVFKMS